MEEWKKIEGFEEYEVSTSGNVRKDGKVLKGGNQGLYKSVLLYKNGKSINRSLHRLVALAFIPNPENKRTVDHIDKNTLNNCVENLRWATSSEQTLHSPPPAGSSGYCNINKTEYDTYKTYIKRNNVVIHRKTFKTLEEAIQARDDFLSNLEKND